MRTHRGFTPRLRQPNEPSQDCTSTPARRLTSARALMGVRRLISACVIIAALSSCAALGPSVRAKPGVAFLLPQGKTAAIQETGIRITFNEVRDDSRFCPPDVACRVNSLNSLVPEGDARIEVTIWRNGSRSDTRILSLISPKNELTSDDLSIRLDDLTPEPRRSNGYTPSHYVAQLVVNRK
jgi:hypothetical protein